MEPTENPTPAALFGLFPSEINNQILAFRQREVELGH